ncbi:MAG TPA: YdeI/OmpD-associated family protein [Terriglobia bacterium]|nr:YdeI/OmpD-associated family protein [Terriglobia bacterium]
MALIEKLKPKAGTAAVINSPKDILGEFKSLKPAVTIPAGAKAKFDFVVLFATTSKELVPAWKRIIPALKEDAAFWVAYPKKTSGIPSDLGMSGTGWEAYKGSPWQPVAMVSINDTWTGTRFKFAPNLESERQQRSTEGIHDADGTLVVDRVNRIIHPPKDLAAVLAKHPGAKVFFDTLSFTNKKEYVVWIVEAKKAETRASRLTLALEKLVSSKKNPSEK